MQLLGKPPNETADHTTTMQQQQGNRQRHQRDQACCVTAWFSCSCNALLPLGHTCAQHTCCRASTDTKHTRHTQDTPSRHLPLTAHTTTRHTHTWTQTPCAKCWASSSALVHLSRPQHPCNQATARHSTASLQPPKAKQTPGKASPPTPQADRQADALMP
jgi:hypothetical protein